jgi:hypothetical protein
MSEGPKELLGVPVDKGLLPEREKHHIRLISNAAVSMTWG